VNAVTVGADLGAGEDDLLYPKATFCLTCSIMVEAGREYSRGLTLGTMQ